MPQAPRIKQITTITGNVVDTAVTPEAAEPKTRAPAETAVQSTGPSGRLTAFGTPVSRLFIDLGKDYTVPVPPRGPMLSWGSVIESQLDLKDAEAPNNYTRPVSLVTAIVAVKEDGIWISWPDYPLKTFIKLGLGASIAWE